MPTTTYLRPPLETLAAIAPWLKRAGVSRVADITGMDRIGIPVFISIRPDSKSLAVDSGKGTTRMQAKCSASMEALERWALDEVPIESFRGSYKSALTNFPLNRGAVVYDGGNPKLTNAVDHRTGETVIVPYYAVKMYEGTEPLQEKPWFATTNGMSSGSTREEAIMGGLFEAIERDGVHMAMERTIKGISLHRVDPESIDDPACRGIMEMTADAGTHLFLYDCRNELRIPTFQCIIVDEERGAGVYKGYGSHSDKWVALCRSMCEAIQGRGVIFAGARDDINWARHRKLIRDSDGVDWIPLLSKEKCTIGMDQIPSIDREILDIMEENGRRALIVDFPIADAPFSCVKVLVPGYASYWLNHAEPGRPK